MVDDVGTGSWENKFRDRPLTWSYEGNTYINERSIGTQQTAWSFVAQLRNWLPDEVGGVFRFAPDDATFAAHVPFYSKGDIPKGWRTGDGSVLNFTFDSQFWLNNLVANRAYSQWAVLAPVIQQEVKSFEDELFAQQEELEDEYLKSGKDKSLKILSKATQEAAAKLKKRWTDLWVQLTVQYRDGVKITGPNCDKCDHGGKIMGGMIAAVTQGSGAAGMNEWPDSWKKRIVDETKDHFLVETGDNKMLSKSGLNNLYYGFCQNAFVYEN